MLNNWVCLAPSQIIFGPNSAQSVSDAVNRCKAKKVLIVTDEVMKNIGILEVIEKSLKSSSIDYFIYDGVKSEPTTEYVEEGLRIYKENGCDLILGVGGGSPIDTIKAISIMTANSGSISDYKGLNKVENKGVPIIAIPTTAGTGSEVTKYTIITDPKTSIKMLIGSNLIIPNVAIVDPMLTLSTPKGLTAATGIDALTHAIEAYTSVKANPLSDLFAIEAIKLISHNLRAAWANGSNIIAREKTMLGSMYAGLAFSNASVALVHGMSRPIGANFHIAHGVSNAALLGIVMEFTYIGAVDRYADIAEAIGLDVYSFTSIEAAKAAVVAVKELIKDLEIPSLAGLGIDKEKLTSLAPQMAQDAIDSGSPGNNLRIATKDEIINLYIKSY